MYEYGWEEAFYYVFTMAATYAASLGLFLMGIGLIMIAREISKR